MALPRSLPPSEDERLDVLRRHMTSGNAGGMSRAVGPIYRRDLAQAAVVGSGDEGLDARESKIDTFSVTGTGTSTFTLTFDPVDDSWNVSCSWDLVSGVDYTISGRTLTVTAPATTFVGASPTYPKTLQAQYDYLAGVPVPPISGGTFVASGIDGGFTGGTIQFTVPAHSAGDLLLAAVSSTQPVTTPTGWSLAGVAGSGTYLHVFYKVGAGGASSTFTTSAAGTTWYASTVLAYGALSFGAAATQEDAVASTSHSTPAVAGSGRIVHVYGGYAAPTWPAGVTSRVAHQTGSSPLVCAADLVGSGASVTFTTASSIAEMVSVRLADA